MGSCSAILEEALEAWAYARQGVIEKVENLPEDRFDFRPTPETRSIAQLTLHIVESGLMMAGELTRPDGDFTRQPFPAFLQEYAGHLPDDAPKRELVELLRTTHAAGEKKIRDAGELLMLQFIKRFDGQKGSRLAWMAHGVAHEEYHRGQLAVYSRLVGRVPALTQLIMKYSGSA